MTDSIADMLTRLRNANRAEHEQVDIPASKLKLEIARVLRTEGYIQDYQLLDDEKQGIIRITLKYGPNKEKVISGLKRISKPSRRLYVTKEDIPIILGGLGIVILSTSRGVITGHEAKQLGVGGEVLCAVW